MKNHKLIFFYCLFATFYILFPVSLFAEYAELSIKSSFDVIIKSQYDREYSCIDSISKLTLKDTYRNNIIFFLSDYSDYSDIVFVTINGKPYTDETSINNVYQNKYIDIKLSDSTAINSKEYTIEVMTRQTQNIDKQRIECINYQHRGNNYNKEGKYTVSAPFPDIKIDKFEWEIYTHDGIEFKGTRITHLKNISNLDNYLQRLKNKLNFNSNKIFNDIEIESSCDTFYKIEKVGQILGTLIVLTLSFMLGGINNLMLTIIQFPKYVFSGKPKKQNGFTLIELIIVIAIIGILASMAQPGCRLYRGDTTDEYFKCAQKNSTFFKFDDELSFGDECSAFGFIYNKNGLNYCTRHGFLDENIKNSKDYYNEYKEKRNEWHRNRFYNETLSSNNMLVNYRVNMIPPNNGITRCNLEDYRSKEINLNNNSYKIKTKLVNSLKSAIKIEIEYSVTQKLKMTISMILFFFIFVLPTLFFKSMKKRGFFKFDKIPPASKAKK